MEGPLAGSSLRSAERRGTPDATFPRAGSVKSSDVRRGARRPTIRCHATVAGARAPDCPRRTTRVVLRAYGTAVFFVGGSMVMETDSVARTANEEGNNGAARVSDPSRRTIDVRRYVAEMARTLCANGDQRACKRALATL